MRRSGVRSAPGKSSRSYRPHWRAPPPALCRPSVLSLRASRGRALRSHAGTGERGVVPNTSSCLPHEQGSPPQTPGPLIGRARHPCSARLPPGPPLRCCGPNYPGGQDGRRWGSNCKSSLSRIRAGRTVYWSSVSTSVGLAPSALDIPALGTIVPEKSGRARAQRLASIATLTQLQPNNQCKGS